MTVVVGASDGSRPGAGGHQWADVKHDPGILDVLRDREQASSRIRLRFTDVETISRCDPLAIPTRDPVGEISCSLSHPPPIEAKLLEYAPGGASDVSQDAVLLRRPVADGAGTPGG